ncbi:uncharacterized protein LOC128033964 [Gossypium raimondii]|uniref:uncharacterized protein LOC128033964 n=1 Tax=Gossypium raimondii TaxID=29730 RepID=UPI00227B7F68|nr:uncharacterized protein LOC128033964 [Gossypium raimondii]
MDFVNGLPLTPIKKDSIWVIMHRLTKSAHSILVRIDYSLHKLVRLYIYEIMRLHRVPISITSYRDPRFASRFWRKLHQALDSWKDYLPLAEFAYNNSYQSSNQMAPYESLYGHRCHTSSCWTELGKRHVLGPELVSNTEDKVKLIRDRLKAATDRQKSYTDLKRREIEYFVGHFIFLKVSPWKKDVFHVSMLRHYHSDPMHIVLVEEIKVRPDLTFEEEPVQILDRNINVLRRKSIPLVKNGPTGQVDKWGVSVRDVMGSNLWDRKGCIFAPNFGKSCAELDF